MVYPLSGHLITICALLWSRLGQLTVNLTVTPSPNVPPRQQAMRLRQSVEGSQPLATQPANQSRGGVISSVRLSTGAGSLEP